MVPCSPLKLTPAVLVKMITRIQVHSKAIQVTKDFNSYINTKGSIEKASVVIAINQFSKQSQSRVILGTQERSGGIKLGHLTGIQNQYLRERVSRGRDWVASTAPCLHVACFVIY